jgi:hypothetical protein
LVSGSLYFGRLHCHHHHHHRQAAPEEVLAWLDTEDEGTVTKAPETTHPAVRCHIPEDLNPAAPHSYVDNCSHRLHRVA